MNAVLPHPLLSDGILVLTAILVALSDVKSNEIKFTKLIVAIGVLVSIVFSFLSLKYFTNNDYGENFSLFKLLHFSRTSAFIRTLIAVMTGAVVLITFYSNEIRKNGKNDFLIMVLLSATLWSVLTISTNLILSLILMQAGIVTTLATCALTKERSCTSEVLLKITISQLFSSVFMMIFVWLMYSGTGSFNITDHAVWVSKLIHSNITADFYYISFLCVIMLLVFLSSACLFPFHFILIDFLEGSAMPAAAWFSSVPIISLFYVFMRWFVLFFMEKTVFLSEKAIAYVGIKDWIAMIGLATITIGVLGAVQQKKIKRFIAYNILAQSGYPLLAFASLSPSGVASAIINLLSMGVLVGGFYYFFEIVMKGNEDTDMDRLNGFFSRSPFEGSLFCILLIAATGMPPFLTFFSRLQTLGSVFETGEYLRVAWIVCIWILGVTHATILLGKTFDKNLINESTSESFFHTKLFATFFIFIILCLGLTSDGIMRHLRDAVQHMSMFL